MNTFFTIIGFIAAICFGFCTLPQILRVLKRKSTADISLLFIILSLLGNLCSASYIFYTNLQSGLWQIPQYFNYSVATTMVITLMVLKLKYDGKQIRGKLSRWVREKKISFYIWNLETSKTRRFFIWFNTILMLGFLMGIIL